jgi:urease accessory protein UreE
MMSVLEVFRSLPVARDVYREDTLPPAARRYARDTITLGWEARLKARGRRRSDGGVEFGTALARGTVLRGGDSFVLDQPPVTIAVVEREEPVFIIEPRAGSEWALYAYHVGNSHQPVMITDRALVCPDVPGMEQVLQYHDIPYARGTRAFTPVGLDLSGHRHQP